METFKLFFEARQHESRRAAVLRIFNQVIRDMRSRGIRLLDGIAESPGYIVSYSDHTNSWSTGYGWKRNRGDELHLDINQVFVPGNLNTASLIADNLPSFLDLENASATEVAGAVLKQPQDEVKRKIEALLPNVQDQTLKFLDKIIEPQLNYPNKLKVQELEKQLANFQQRRTEYEKYLREAMSTAAIKNARMNIKWLDKQIALYQKRIAIVRAKAKIIGESDEYERGFNPPFLWSDIGKFIVMYKDTGALVKGTSLYDTKEEADEICKLCNDPNIVVRQLGFPNG